MGIKKVQPKQIQMCLKIYVNRESIGSHLQKYRIKLMKAHGLNTPQEITNRHFPIDIKHSVLDQIKKMWDDPRFDGLSVQEITLLLDEMID
ncbi:Conserved_hypothetical protein [Hexamita inflata]|uniref:Uncharacterized protein n=1 Tax=Hexamita inflata TaxID=28002 RepID=A0AA86NEW3_9EUKA|nr:Conserved hypothetical protein [Hexamita inflata]CAI9930226.1 Conserved hypothetical protein [Hexamita inflata]CAI9931076.1 Conserved hypothetical protein [Hexamita inflata]CAI9941254.1 Conserved hypothetical protein [Hexamita inflata]